MIHQDETYESFPNRIRTGFLQDLFATSSTGVLESVLFVVVATLLNTAARPIFFGGVGKNNDKKPTKKGVCWERVVIFEEAKRSKSQWYVDPKFLEKSPYLILSTNGQCKFPA